ncbi:MAG: G5 domain-containing protein [bacterium]
MNSQSSETRAGKVILIAIAAAIAIIGFDYYTQKIYVSCTSYDINYQVITNDDATKASGTTTITQAGVKGTKTKCVKKDGTVVSDNVVSQPVNEIIARGTMLPTPPLPPPTSYRTGAICRDGSRSYATGRGACSWHGGVSYWLEN